jgi:hypothetical protein
LAAQKAYYSGYPTRTTLEVYFPKGITSITDVSKEMTGGIIKSELVFTIKRGSAESSLPAVLPFKIDAALRTTDGKRRVLIKAEQMRDANNLLKTYVNITDVN